MTVKELMERLAQFDENMEVKIIDGDWAEKIEDEPGSSWDSLVVQLVESICNAGGPRFDS